MKIRTNSLLARDWILSNFWHACVRLQLSSWSVGPSKTSWSWLASSKSSNPTSFSSNSSKSTCAGSTKTTVPISRSYQWQMACSRLRSARLMIESRHHRTRSPTTSCIQPLKYSGRSSLITSNKTSRAMDSTCFLSPNLREFSRHWTYFLCPSPFMMCNSLSDNMLGTIKQSVAMETK